MQVHQEDTLDLSYLDKIIDDEDCVLGEIYIIENSINGKKYIGQTVTHRLNHGRYRPFGYEKRYRHHMSQAKCNSPSKPCYELQTAMRANPDKFQVRLLRRCHKDDLEELEKYYISLFNTMVPFGYNQTSGGRFRIEEHVCTKATRIIPDLDHNKRVAGDSHTEETKKKIGERIKAYCEENPEYTAKISNNTKQQHLDKKFDIMMHMSVDLTKLDDYMKVRHAKGTPYIVVLDGLGRKGTHVAFYDKTGNLEDCKTRAREFLIELKKRQDEQQKTQ